MLRILALSALVAVVSASPKAYTPTRDVSSPCPSAVVASNATALVGDNVVLLEVLTCAAGSTKGPVANVNIGQAIENLLCHIIPIFCPPTPFNPDAQPTRTVTQTVVRTSTLAVPTTIVKTATATLTEVDTVTFATTDIETATATLVFTETDIATFATTLIDETTLIAPTTLVEISTVVEVAPTTVLVTAPAPTPTAAPAASNVCGEICAVTCSSLGIWETPNVGSMSLWSESDTHVESCRIVSFACRKRICSILTTRNPRRSMSASRLCRKDVVVVS
ncbi:hypothetical protein PENSPDRAFT_655488 [Peniophora sp. CONT]|nr:hypothetical protein PENSPDRAFT_655488 [Peniophora sp. CONT]